ncbi:MAG: phosphoribosyltransferase family protein [Alphaproteobacteria bacterium]
MSGAKVFIAWAEVEHMARRVAKTAQDFGPTAILAVTRGGLVPATLISHHLGVRRVETIQAASYGQGHEQNAVRLGPTPTFTNSDRVLIVDDLIDTGLTLDAIVALYPTARTAVLLNKHPSKTANYVGRHANPSAWIVFPWEPVS